MSIFIIIYSNINKYIYSTAFSCFVVHHFKYSLHSKVVVVLVLDFCVYV
jgi:hypothetical protein